MKHGGFTVCITCLHVPRNHTAAGEREDKKICVIVGCECRPTQRVKVSGDGEDEEPASYREHPQ